MIHAREEVVALAQEMFGEGRLDEVLAMLDEYGTEAHEHEVNRVKLAILRLSGGKTDRLMYWVKAAKVDYRDPLAAQQLGPLSPTGGAELRDAAGRLIEQWGKK